MDDGNRSRSAAFSNAIEHVSCLYVAKVVVVIVAVVVVVCKISVSQRERHGITV